MVFLDDYSQFKYTKVQAELTLKANPNDYEDCISYIDIAEESFKQEMGYIGEHQIEDLTFTRISSVDSSAKRPAKWKVEFVLSGAKREDETIIIMENLCETLSLNCVRQFKYIQNSGVSGFSFSPMNVKRSYAKENRLFGEIDFNHRCGAFEMTSTNTLANTIFELPITSNNEAPLQKKLRDAFLKAMRSTDQVARYVLLYYLFEIFYSTPQYITLKKAYEDAQEETKKKVTADEKRGEILYQYLCQEFHLTGYVSFFEKVPLSADILSQIIKTRNDLTHRADTSNINKLMYHHLIPILQHVIA